MRTKPNGIEPSRYATTATVMYVPSISSTFREIGEGTASAVPISARASALREFCFSAPTLQCKASELRVLRTARRQLAFVQEEFGCRHCTELRCRELLQVLRHAREALVRRVSSTALRPSRSRPRQRQVRRERVFLARNSHRLRRDI